jgi:hypothetical protein
MRVTCIIPSLNRACQLDLLLRSIRENWQMNDLDIHVIYKYDELEYLDGYAKISEDFPHIKWHAEDLGVFSDIIKNIIKKSKNSTIGFFVDDCVMFRKPSISVTEVDRCVSIWNDMYVGFSLRLGQNTIVQNYLTGELQHTLQAREVMYNVVEWNWKRYPRTSNYGYWFSWDGHFYSKELLTSDRVFSKYFGIHRDLEHQLITDNELYVSLPNKMLACKASSVFVNTVNTVQTDGAIPAGVKYGYSTKQLNDRFLAGDRISLDSFTGHPIISCHEEFPLVWTGKI